MSNVRVLRDGLEWSDAVGSIQIDVTTDLRHGCFVVRARVPTRRLVAAGEHDRAVALIDALRGYVSTADDVRGSMLLQLEDGRLEGPGGVVQEGFITAFPVLRSSEGWSARDGLIAGGRPVTLGAGLVELGDQGAVGWLGRLLVRWPSLVTRRLPDGGRRFVLTGVLAVVTPAVESQGAESPEERLSTDRIVELGERAYRAVDFSVRPTDVEPFSGAPAAAQAVLAATSSLTTLEDLERLATDPRGVVRAAVASNPAAPAEAVERLVLDPSPTVRAAVALNPGASSSACATLARDGDELVRITNAWSAGRSADVLRLLMGDEAWTVRFAAADNPRSPVEVVERAVDDGAWQVRAAAAARVDLPFASFERLAGDEHRMVRMAAAASPLCTPQQLDSFASSSDPELREVVEGLRSRRYHFEDGLRHLPLFGADANASPYA